MNKQTLKAAIIALMFIVGPIACENCGETDKYFNVVGLHAINLEFTGTGANPWKQVELNDTVLWTNFFIRAGFDKTYFSEIRNSSGNYLYADCIGSGYLGSKIGVDTLYLVSLVDYNERFHQHDTLNSILLTHDWTYRVEDFNEFDSITNYIDKHRAGIKDDVFELKISEPPSDIGDYAFRLIYKLNNGETFVAETDTVRLSL